jgi:hypothetical protein
LRGRESGVSQQHIQRIETQPDINVGFRLAVRLCEVLGRSLVEIFPQTRHILERVPAEETDALPTMLDASEEMEAAGRVSKAGVRVLVRARRAGLARNYLTEQLSATPGSIWQRRTCSYTTPFSI